MSMNANTKDPSTPVADIPAFNKQEHYAKAREAHEAMNPTQLVMLLSSLAHSAEEAEHGSLIRKRLLAELDSAQDVVIARMSR